MCDNIAADPEGRFLLVGCWPFQGFDCKTLLIDTKEGKITRDLHVSDRIFTARFNKNGTKIWMKTSNYQLTGENGIVYDLNGNVVRDFDPKDFSYGKNQRLWVIESSKDTFNTHGLYLKDDEGKTRRLSRNVWHDNFGMTKDGRFVAATTWDGDLIVWRIEDGELVFKRKMASQYGGYMAYDEVQNRFLIGDVVSDGTTFLRALEMDVPSRDK